MSALKNKQRLQNVNELNWPNKIIVLCCLLFDYVFERGCVQEGAGEGTYSTSNLFLVYVLCTMICKAFHAFLELSKLQGGKNREGGNGLRQITVYWKEFLLCRRGRVCADTFGEMNKVAV